MGQHCISKREESGAALVLALVFVVFSVGFVLAGSDSLKSARDRTTVGLNLNGHASQFARAGLIEATRWFRQQPAQPVLAFAPRNDLDGETPRHETEEPEIGLVREFRVHGRIHGRYEVWKQWADDPDPGRKIFRDLVHVVDASESRDVRSDGAVWRLRCIAYVYDQRDENAEYWERPNRVLAAEVLETEISRLAVRLPGQAALSVGNPGQLEIGSGVRIDGGETAAGIVYRAGGIRLGSLLGAIGSPAATSVQEYEDHTHAVFGVSEDMLRSMASTYVETAADFPRRIEGMPIIVSDADLVFDHERPLRGAGILYVNGDLELRPGSNSFFNGLIFVRGRLTMAAPAEIRGAVVAQGAVSMRGIGDYATIKFDGATIDRLQRQIGSYRFSRAIRRAQFGNLTGDFFGGLDIDPDDLEAVDPEDEDTGPVMGLPEDDDEDDDERSGSDDEADEDDDRGRSGSDRGRSGSDDDRGRSGSGDDRGRSGSGDRGGSGSGDRGGSGSGGHAGSDDDYLDRLSPFFRRR